MINRTITYLDAQGNLQMRTELVDTKPQAVYDPLDLQRHEFMDALHVPYDHEDAPVRPLNQAITGKAVATMIAQAEAAAVHKARIYPPDHADVPYYRPIITPEFVDNVVKHATIPTEHFVTAMNAIIQAQAQTPDILDPEYLAKIAGTQGIDPTHIVVHADLKHPTPDPDGWDADNGDKINNEPMF